MSFWRSDYQAYAGVAKLFHWISALTILGLFGLGFWMTSLDYYHPWYKKGPDLHRSIGVLLMTLTAARFLYRRIMPLPPMLTSYSQFTQKSAKLGHQLFYVLLLLLLISGYLITTAKGESLHVFNWFQIPGINLGIKNLEDIAGNCHAIIAYSLIFFAIIHSLAALKHHFIDKDMTLRRMTWHPGKTKK
jgi:cytochrome b561